jgi:hypothetical protein
MARRQGRLLRAERAPGSSECTSGAQTGTRKYHNHTIHGPFHEAQRSLNLSLQQRDNDRVSRAAVLSLNQLLDQWLSTVVKACVAVDPGRCGRQSRTVARTLNATRAELSPSAYKFQLGRPRNPRGCMLPDPLVRDQVATHRSSWKSFRFNHQFCLAC